MPTLTLTAYKAQPYEGGYSIALNLGGGGEPFPSRNIDIRTTDDGLAALAAYAAEASAACDTPVAVSATLGKGQRAPRGWRALSQRQTTIPANF